MLLRHQASEERDEHIDMTPMVDVVFQLMTFMLFSVQLTAGDTIEIPPARHGVGVEEHLATFLTLMKPTTPNGEPTLILGNGGGPVISFEQATKAVSDGLRDGKKKVVLQADGGVPHGEVLKLAAAVTLVEGVTLHIGVQEAER
jgi:biopolymer transport protein ExbD